jgi:predicted enzyme related to lactoylglutathione lyase
MKKRISVLISIIVFLGYSSLSQPLKDKLESLRSDYNFNYSELATNTEFSEKYLVNFVQQLDYKGGSKKTFTQRVFISHKSFDRSVVFITEGYAANHAESPNFQSELSSLLDANQVCIEHRYFSASRPDSIVWEYLTVENAANDLHRIAQFIKEIYPGKLISTGISKGGQTTNFFKYFFPDDADICVPYVAPLNFSVEDKRVYSFLKKVGSQECRNRILEFQRNMLKNKDLILPEFKKLAQEKNLHYSMGYEKAYELLVFEYSFAFWQWGNFKCGDIPSIDQKPVKLIKHLDKVAGIDWISIEGIHKLQAFFYQAMHEIGMYGYDIEAFKGLTSYTKNPVFDFSLPKGINVEYDGEIMQRIDFYLRHKAENMIFIYGEYDPWFSTAVEPAYHTNTFRVVKKGGSHRTRINSLDSLQRQMVLDSLKVWIERPAKHKKEEKMEKKKKVTGIGGVFFKSSNPAEMRKWYSENLGLVTNEYGSLFEFRESDDANKKAYLQWSPFSAKTKYFEPSQKEFMINYRVENIVELVEELKQNGVSVLDEIETYEYGKFVHILDPENNKIELWEPVDSVFTKLYDGKTTK